MNVADFLGWAYDLSSIDPPMNVSAGRLRGMLRWLQARRINMDGMYL